MAEVWEATDEVLTRRVAVKVLFAHLCADPAAVSRFRREALAVARINHPGIVAVYDTVAGDGIEAIVLELVDGPTLRDRLAAERMLDETEVVELGRALADALDAAHRAGVVHRDIKPSNILLGPDGSPRLADFGVATDGGDGPTVIGTMVGTAAYVSPEQVAGDGADARSDVYSLATLLYEAACGRTPFREDNDAATALARLRADAPDVRLFRPALSAGLAEALARALARDPARRTMGAAALRSDLLRVTTSTVSRTVEPPPDLTGVLPTATLTPEMRPARTVPAGTRPATRPARSHPAAPAAPGRVAAAPGRVAGGRRRRPLGRRRGAWMVVSGLLVGGSVLLVAALVKPSATTRPDPVPTTVAAAPVRITAALPLDPLGTGAPGENDATAALVLDEDPATTWRTEGYDHRDFRTKPGVGLSLRLAGPSRVEALEIDSVSTGWVAEISVLDRLDEVPPPTAGRRVEIGPGTSRVPVGAITGGVVLLWIVQLGEPEETGRHVVEIRGIRVVGTPVDG